MSSRFARPTPAARDRCRSERDALRRAARIPCDAHGDAGVTLGLVVRARERQRGVPWARKALGLAATMPASGLGSMGGRP